MHHYADGNKRGRRPGAVAAMLCCAAASLMLLVGCGPEVGTAADMEMWANSGRLADVEHTLLNSDDEETRTEAMHQLLRINKPVSIPKIEEAIDKELVDKDLGEMVLCGFDRNKCEELIVPKIKSHCDAVAKGEATFADGKGLTENMAQVLAWIPDEASSALKNVEMATGDRTAGFSDMWRTTGGTAILHCLPGAWMVARFGTAEDQERAISFIRGGPTDQACRLSKMLLADAGVIYKKRLEEVRMGLAEAEGEARCLPPVSPETREKAPSVVEKRVKEILGEVKARREYSIKVEPDGKYDEEGSMVLGYVDRLLKAGDIRLVLDNLEKWTAESSEAKFVLAFYLREKLEDPWLDEESKGRIDAILDTMEKDTDSFRFYLDAPPGGKKVFVMSYMAKKLKAGEPLTLWPDDLELVPLEAPTPAPGQPDPTVPLGP